MINVTKEIYFMTIIVITEYFHDNSFMFVAIGMSESENVRVIKAL